ncbi:MAG: FKBP-type peptidyl-prolyl cis-trans isomerase [Bacteroidales bacterium]|nr:FKBP-type peptidyl-prolyl cis-trans isomerase [Bacteroidales bacterium]
MKKALLYLGLAALLLSACAKTPNPGKNAAAKRYLDSWIQVNHPDAQKTPLGAYVLEETPGTGAAVGAADTDAYVRVECTISDLAGAISYTSDATLARQLGTYSEQGYYGPVTWRRSDNALVAGLEELVGSMRCGGAKKVVIPGWLMGADSQTGLPIIYDTAQEYLDKISGGSPSIYTVTLKEIVPDIVKWETDSVDRYVARLFPGTSVKDTLARGFYYRRTAAPSDEEAFHKDTTIYINYIGRRLDGVVFDTNIADTAKYYGLYSASRTYGPAKIKWYGADQGYSDITMTASGSSAAGSVVNGFSKALDQMHPHEKGTAVFYSGWGYGSRSSGSTIPAYSPLRFDLEIVDKP